ISEYVIHRICLQFDNQQHYLPPPRSSSPQSLPTGECWVRVHRNRYWGPRDRHDQDADELERAIARRRWVYQRHLYAKVCHGASCIYTCVSSRPAPAKFATSPDMTCQPTIFLRPELRVWQNLDVEFLTTSIISLMNSIDIRAESAVKLLSEFLDLDTFYIEGRRHPNAELLHMVSKIYCYMRSGRDLSIYDNLVQYDTSPDPPPHKRERANRWCYNSRSRSRSPHHRFRSRSPLSRPPSPTLRTEHRRTPPTTYLHRPSFPRSQEPSTNS
ncbi:uncharacterized protein HD556DRAFT_1246910, partial [Suillus plorans]